MFTGIVETVGRVLLFQREGLTTTLRVEAPEIARGSALGDSIAIDGVCTTVTQKDDSSFTVQLQEETLRRTACHRYAYGTLVNLERAVTPSTRLGGHFVQGHVDCCVPVRSFHQEGQDLVLRFQLPPELLKYAVPKGFIAINGISLTLCDTVPLCSVHVIPATLEHTTLKGVTAGSLVNIETDILGKYVFASLQK